MQITKNLIRPALAGLIVLAAALSLSAPSSAALPCGGTWWISEGDLAVGQPLPEFGFATCNGEELATSDFAGRPLLVNFWATWCAPCVKELPHFAELHEEYGDEVTVLGVSVDQHPDYVRAFLEHNPLPYLLAWDSEDIAGDLGFNSIPVTLAIDAEGNLAGVHRGYASQRDLEELIELASANAAADDAAEDDGAAGEPTPRREGLEIAGSE
ncbi:TlpA family protein disulfide reductase [bacterium]|nr:TlpA family protein disulfide reductase [bacterium]